MRLKLHNLRLFGRRQILAVLAIVLISCATLTSAWLTGRDAQAATLGTINFQARLMNDTGSIVPDGFYNVEFKLYDVSSGGTALWTETYYDSNGGTAGNDNRTRVANGYVTVNLGFLTSFPGTIDWDQEVWLTMNVGGSNQTATPTWDGEMSPRLKLTAVPYAFRAGQLAQFNSGNNFTSTLSIVQPTGGDQTFQIPDQGAGGTYTLLTTTAANAAYIQLQGSTPGSAQTGHFNISGTGIAGTALQAPLLKTADGTGASTALTVRTGNSTSSGNTGNLTLDTGDASGGNSGNVSIDVGTASGTTGTVSIGTAQASGITIGRTGITTTFSGHIAVAANQNLTLANGTGVLGQTYTNSSAGSAQTLSVTNSNSGGSSVAVNGQQITLVGTATSGGTNSNTAISFANPSAATNNNYYGLNFAGTGYTDILRVNGTQIINGSGVIQSAGLSGSYTGITGVGTLTTGALGAGFTTVAVAQGGTGATTFTGNGVLYGNGTGAIQATAAGTTGQCLLGNTGSAPGWGACATGTVTLQTAYNASTDPEIVLGSAATAGITIRDNSTPIAGNLLEVQNNAGGTTYLGVTTSGISVTGNVDAGTGTIIGSTFRSTDQSAGSTNSAATTFRSGNVSGATSNSGTVTVQSGNSSTSGNTGNVSIASGNATSGNSGNVSIDVGTASGTLGQISLGTTTATTVNVGAVGSTNKTSTIHIADTSDATSAQAVTIGSAASNTSNITIVQGGSNTTQSIQLLPNTAGGIMIGATAGTGTITLGQSTASNTISVGSANLTSGTPAQNINIGNGSFSTGATVAVNILSGSAGSSGTATLSLGNNDRVTQIDIGNVAADAARTLNFGTGSNTVAVDTINIGTGATTVAGGKTIHIGDGTPSGSGTNLITIGTSATAGSTVTLQGVVKLSNPGSSTANAVALCRDSSTTNLIACDSGAGGTPFIQGGNSFGATGVLGTNDANNLQFETNNVVRATFDQSNGLYLGNGITAAAPNNFIVAGTGSSTAGTAGANLTLQGGAGASATTGSAGGNILIAGGNGGGSGNNAGGTITLQGGLDSNSGTPGTVLVKNSADSATAFSVQNAAGTSTVLDVDTTNTRVGIGTAAPARTLDISVNNSLVDAPSLRILQGGSGDAALELNTSSTTGGNFYVGQDASSGGAFVINSSIAAGGLTTPTHVQTNVSANSGAASSTTINQVFGSNNTAGNMIVAAVTWFGSGGLTCSDTQGNSYTTVTTAFDSTEGQSLGVCYALNVAAGANTVTGTIANSAFRAISISEYSGVALASAVDVFASQGGGSGSTPSSGTANTTQSGDLIYGVVMDTSGTNWSDTAIAAGAGFTERGENDGLSPESQVQGSAGSISATWTFNASSRYDAIMVAFKAAVGPVTDTFSNPLFKMTPSGALTLKNQADSTTALQVQNAAGTTSVFNVDTSNGRIGINTNAPTADLSFGAGASRTINVLAQPTAATAGNNLTISAGTGNTSGIGGTLALQGGTGGNAATGGVVAIQGGNAGGGNTNGANVTITGGTPTGTGARGLVVVDTPTFTTATSDANCYTGGALVASSCTITTTSVNNSGAVIVGFNTSGQTATLPDPTILTAGRLMYITGANGSSDFTLSVNGGGTGNLIGMRQNTTATMIWNGADWTAAGASSSTDLQSAYNNTLTSAGGAELVLNAPGGSADGLTIRNNATTPIIGGILEVQTSIGSNLFAVNNNATEYANNGGAESSTFTMWVDASTGGAETVSRNTTTTGNIIATGQASTRVDTTTVVAQGAENTLSTTLSNGLKYQVSFAIKAAASSFTTLDTMYSYDGSATNVRHCVSGTPFYSTGTASQSGTTITGVGTAWTSAMVGKVFVFANGSSTLISGFTNATTLTAATSQTVSTVQNYASYNAGYTVSYGTWSRVTCTFVAPPSGTTITASNSVMIRQTDATSRTFYIDNLSVTVAADVNHAADGSVDDATNFTTNWTDFDGGTGSTTLVRNTSTIYDTSASTEGQTTANATQGIRNNMSIAPSINTQYLVTFYARASVAMTDTLSVGFLPAGGTTAPTGDAACSDYSTRSLSTSSWTKITCLFTTAGTAISNADLVIFQTDATARSIFVDALSVTLNTNTASNVQVGGANKGGPTTLFTLDRGSSAPIASNNDAYLGSMYYDTTSGRIQCYEADGWGACGAAPDNIVNLNPEYAGAVLNGTGIGTMTADFCSNDTALTVNNTLCSTGQAKNFYRWTSPQATQQTYSIYVTYQLPATFNGFASDDTVQLVARVDNTTNASVTYEMFKSTGSTVTQCGSGETNIITGGGGSANTWYSYGINGNESTGCSFNSASAGNFVIFKINLKTNSNANAYVSTLSFTTTGR